MNDIWKPRSNTLIGLAITTTRAATDRLTNDCPTLPDTMTNAPTLIINAERTAETGIPTSMTYVHTAARTSSCTTKRHHHSLLPRQSRSSNNE